MNQSKISVRYAKALFELAKEQNVLKEIKSDVESILEVYNLSPELANFLTSPIFKGARKKEVLQKTFSSSVSPLTVSFLNMLVDNKREGYLRNIALYFNDLVKSDLGIQSVSISSAAPLSDNAKANLVQAVKKAYNKEIELSINIDESLIGGFILRVEDKQLDASVASRLREIKRVLTDKK